MKVPYLNRKIAADFGTYLTELDANVRGSILAAKARPDSKELFSTLYPLFTLVQGLTNTEYYRSPSREILATEYQARHDKAGFLRVRGQRLSGVDDKLLREGLKRIDFGTHFNELFSDGLILLNSFYTNNYRGAGISLRCMLEDLYRSVYYRDHPEELSQIENNRDVDEFELGLKPITLREYLRRVSYLKVFRGLTVEFLPKLDPKESDIFALNEDLYGLCSSFVHGSKGEVMASLQSNEELKFDTLKADGILKATDKAVMLSVACLIPAYLDHFVAFNEYEKSIVLMAFTGSARANFRKVLNI